MPNRVLNLRGGAFGGGVLLTSLIWDVVGALQRGLQLFPCRSHHSMMAFSC